MSARRTGAVHRHRADLPAGGKVATRTSLPGTVLVLNASFEPMHRVSLKHAISMLVREVAVVHEAVGEASFGPFPVPRVLRLVRYVAMAWRYRRGSLGPVCSKAGVKARDKVCAYCGGPAETVDHVLPRSRGGGSDWLNLVAACVRCIHRKADRTPAEAGMRLRVTPYVPRITLADYDLVTAVARPALATPVRAGQARGERSFASTHYKGALSPIGASP